MYKHSQMSSTYYFYKKNSGMVIASGCNLFKRFIEVIAFPILGQTESNNNWFVNRNKCSSPCIPLSPSLFLCI